MTIIKSFNKAIEYLQVALVHTNSAFLEVHKWNHPIDGEISGILYQINSKITRLEQLRIDLKNNTVNATSFGSAITADTTGNIGERVIVKYDPKRDRTYNNEAVIRRIACDGKVGTIIAIHNSHGKCYDVKFDDEVVVPYDPEEIHKYD